MIQFVEEWPPTGSRFRPGQSGNPGGRPKAIRLALRKAAKHSPRAVQVLFEIMNDAKQDTFARLAAAKLILDRGLGKLQEVELPPEAAEEERELTPEELRYGERVLRIDHYHQEGWRIPPELSRYEAALRILREPDPEEGLPHPQELGSRQSSKQLPEDATDEPSAVENGSHQRDPYAPPTALPFAVWK